MNKNKVSSKFSNASKKPPKLIGKILVKYVQRSVKNYF